MVTKMALGSLLFRWRVICNMVLDEHPYRFDSQEERDQIIETLVSDRRYFTVSNGQVTDVGWTLCDWGERLSERHKEWVLWNGLWYDLDNWEQRDLGQIGIIQECYERFPYVDTTVFVEFDEAVLELWNEGWAAQRHRDAIDTGVELDVFHNEFHCERLDGDQSYLKAKSSLRDIYNRALLVAKRIDILLSGKKGDPLPTPSSVISTSENPPTETDPSPRRIWTSRLNTLLCHVLDSRLSTLL